MALQLKQNVKLSQQLVMTPQLQQAIKLLQLSRLELVGVVQKELQENPVLEEVADGDDDHERGGELTSAATLADATEATLAATPEIQESADSASADGVQEREPTDAEKIADIDWQNYMDARPHTGMREVGGDADRPGIDQTHSRQESLSDHLEWQLQLARVPIEEEVAAHFIIGNIDDRGYLSASIAEIAIQSGVREEVVEAALAVVQSFEPTGVASRDLRECLSLQLDAREISDPLVRRILAEALDPFIGRDFRKVARQLDVEIADVVAASDVIAQLEPRPARGFGSDETIYIVPDIYVHRLGDDFHIVLNDDGMPRLRITGLYKDMLGKNSTAAADTREYVSEKVRSAMWLTKSIHQRQRTIYKVMESVIKHQRLFFERGVNHLKPLNLRDVADDIGMHESTVSRVTSNKYAHTPQGIFELKYFFNSSIRGSDGEAVASESVKHRIRRLIKSEDAMRPLSDQRIAEMLRVAKINIARRTVTKYRESMNILSSTKRRRLV
ncbi:MAG: RNA polymerase factor sigma-54 [Myxococcota bacterium]